MSYDVAGGRPRASCRSLGCSVGADVDQSGPASDDSVSADDRDCVTEQRLVPDSARSAAVSARSTAAASARSGAAVSARSTAAVSARSNAAASARSNIRMRL